MKWDDACLLLTRLVKIACALLLATFFGFFSYACFRDQRWGAVPLALFSLWACISCMFSAYNIALRKEGL
jgi:hypothetical protein